MGIADPQVIDKLELAGGARDSLSNAPPLRTRKKAEKPPLPCRLVSLEEAARYLSVSDWSVRQMVWRGDLPHVRLGKRILLDAKDLDAWIEREKVRGT